MAKATKGRKPAKSRGAPAKKSFAKRAGAKARPAGKGKASGKKFFVGKAPRPALGRKVPGAAAGARPGMKQAALRPGTKLPARKAPAHAAPVSAPVVTPKLPPDNGQLRALAAVAAGADKKADNPVVLDVRGLSGVADYFVILSAESDRQAAAVADGVDDRVTAMGAHRLGAEGRSGGGWVLLDFGDVVVHVMSAEARGFYDLEGLWADAPRVPVAP
jgi:ribosome-associated protein